MKRIIFFVLGCITLIIGCIGLLLPIIPQVPFLLLSVFFFAESSEWIKNRVKKYKFYKQVTSFWSKKREKQ